MSIGFDGLRALDDEQRAAVIEQAFRNLVASDDGKIVLATLLEELHLLDRSDTPEFQALNNYAKVLAARCGLSSTYRLIEACTKKEL